MSKKTAAFVYKDSNMHMDMETKVYFRTLQKIIEMALMFYVL